MDKKNTIFLRYSSSVPEPFFVAFLVPPAGGAPSVRSTWLSANLEYHACHTSRAFVVFDPAGARHDCPAVYIRCHYLQRQKLVFK